MSRKLQKIYGNVASVLIMSMMSSFLLPFSYTANAAFNDPSKNFLLDPKSTASGGALGTGSDALDTGGGFFGSDLSSYTSKVLGCGSTTKRLTSLTSDLSSASDAAARSTAAASAARAGEIPVPPGGSSGYDDGYVTKTITDSLASTATQIPGEDSAGTQAVADKELQKAVDTLNARSLKTLQIEEDKQIWDQCLSGIAYNVTKLQLASMTQRIINWANGGFGGNPLYIKDSESYFKNLANQNLASYVSLIGFNNDLYPFGRNIAQSLINNSKSTYNTKAQSTLTNSLVPGATTSSFASNFAQGGWGGWFALTQNPANNPLGFQLLTTQEIADKNAAKKEDIRAQQIGHGFIDEKVCAEYKKNASDSNRADGTITLVGTGAISITSKQVTTTTAIMRGSYMADSNVNLTSSIHKKDDATIIKTDSQAVKTGFNEVSVDFSGLTKNTQYVLDFSIPALPPAAPGTLKQIAEFLIQTSASVTMTTLSPDYGTSLAPLNSNDPNCVRYETTTPGSLIATSLDAVITSPTRQLETANNINQSLSTLFSNLISQLTSRGFASLGSYTSATNSGSVDTGTGLDNFGGVFIPNINYYNSLGYLIQVNKGYGGWYNSGYNFDITQDLGDIFTKDPVTGKKVVAKKGVITLQQEYIANASDAKKALDPILPALGKLDYCIPGPNPNWENLALQNIVNMQNNLLSLNFNGTKTKVKDPNTVNSTVGGAVTTLASVGAGAAAGAIWGTAVPGIGNIVGAAVGAIIGVGISLYNYFNTKKADENRALAEGNYAKAEQDFYRTNINIARKMYTHQFLPYKDAIDERYGHMTEQFLLDSNGDPTTNLNPGYLPMAADGIALTKNLTTYDANIQQAKKDYDVEIAAVKANTAKLKKIKRQVDLIMKNARKRMADKVTAAIAAIDAHNTSGGPLYTGPDPFCGLDTIDTRNAPITNGPSTGTTGGIVAIAGNGTTVVTNPGTGTTGITPITGNGLGVTGPNSSGIVPIGNVNTNNIINWPECSDAIDNDGDKLIDNKDPQCHTDGDATNASSYDVSIDREWLPTVANFDIESTEDAVACKMAIKASDASVGPIVERNWSMTFIQDDTPVDIYTTPKSKVVNKKISESVDDGSYRIDLTVTDTDGDTSHIAKYFTVPLRIRNSNGDICPN